MKCLTTIRKTQCLYNNLPHIKNSFMKTRTIKTTSLPDQITTNAGTVLKMYSGTIAASSNREREILNECERLKSLGVEVCIIASMSKNLRGKNDLHGQPYKPNLFIFADLHKPEQIEAWRDKVEFWKKQFSPRTRKWMIETKKRNNRPRAAELWDGNEAAQNQAIKELLN